MIASRLRARGVLGLNRRNADYIRRLNPRRLYPLVDDKIRTKELALAAGMAVPELYGVISTQHDIRHLPELIGQQQRFVVKPAHGSGGNGILVISGRQGDLYRKSSGLRLDESELRHHVSNTLSGLYSLGGQRDRALIEYCVAVDPFFEDITYQGVPDIRVIVFLGYPVMAMVRLPTRSSDGKANLHQGAIGVGIDLATGMTLGGVQGNQIVSEHPDTAEPIGGRSLPAWEKILELAARCHDMTGLGYLGVDAVLDRDLGPLILELNARPGLNIQIANRQGLGQHLRLAERKVTEDDGAIAPLTERLSYARQHFRSA